MGTEDTGLWACTQYIRKTCPESSSCPDKCPRAHAGPLALRRLQLFPPSRAPVSIRKPCVLNHSPCFTSYVYTTSPSPARP